jgi:hypothetical protein
MQDDSREKVNILGMIVSIIVKNPHENVSDYEWLPRYGCLNLQIQHNGKL